MRTLHRFEWPTFALLFACYGLWTLGLVLLPLGLAGIAVAIAVALHASLQHEVIHGHPTPSEPVNEALVWPALGLLVPYGRFRDTHLAHHYDARLTDPYDDPESNYLDARAWDRLPLWQRRILLANNTLLGRVLLGPAVGQWAFMRTDWCLAQTDAAIRTHWAWHGISVVCVLTVVWAASMPVWAYLLATYLGHGLIKIRTFLEHQAHDRASNRTAIVEDRGPLALLFLNNNLHAVHHRHPRVPWYRLPRVYARNRARYLRCNGGYAFPSYRAVIQAYLLRRKDPVAHPLWHQGQPPR